MEQIEVNSCDFSKKDLLLNNSKSLVYHDQSYIYKINKIKRKFGYSFFYKARLSLLSSLDISDCIFPNAVLKDRMKIVGIRSDYFFGKSLHLYFDYCNDLGKFLSLIKKVSEKYYEIHQRPENIVLGDANLTNVLYDQSGNIKLIDFEDCGIDFVKPTTWANSYGNYMNERYFSEVILNKESDILSLYLEIFKIVFSAYIDDVSNSMIDTLTSQCESFANMKEIIKSIQKYGGVYKLPYPHELISNNDIKRKNLILNR